MLLSWIKARCLNGRTRHVFVWTYINSHFVGFIELKFCKKKKVLQHSYVHVCKIRWDFRKKIPDTEIRFRKTLLSDLRVRRISYDHIYGTAVSFSFPSCPQYVRRDDDRRCTPNLGTFKYLPNVRSLNLTTCDTRKRVNSFVNNVTSCIL